MQVQWQIDESHLYAMNPVRHTNSSRVGGGAPAGWSANGPLCFIAAEPRGDCGSFAVARLAHGGPAGAAVLLQGVHGGVRGQGGPAGCVQG